MEIAQRLVTLLQELAATVTSVESCTGGHIISTITNIEGASEVTPGGYVTYSNQQKINVGIPKGIIEQYGVYSYECAKAMAVAGRKNTGADFSIGVTGTFSNVDPNNDDSEPGVVYFSIVFNTEQATAGKINVPIMERAQQKEYVTEIVLSKVLEVVELIHKALHENGLINALGKIPLT